MKLTPVVAVLVASLFALGSCSRVGSASDGRAEATPSADSADGKRTGDGSTTDASRGFSNAVFEVPTPTSELGMTCPWLDGDNCWKQMLEDVARCGPPPGAVGRLSTDGTSCAFADGHVIDFAGTVSLLGADAGTSSTVIIAYRMRAPGGSTCLETAYGWGKTRFRVGSRDYFHTLAGISSQVTCPDGTRYSQSHPDTCAQFFDRWAAGQTPQHYFVTCSSEECYIKLTGATGGSRVIARCGP
jgi:hypothetical protein